MSGSSTWAPTKVWTFPLWSRVKRQGLSLVCTKPSLSNSSTNRWYKSLGALQKNIAGV